jgi:hypothetical protein
VFIIFDAIMITTMPPEEMRVTRIGSKQRACHQRALVDHLAAHDDWHAAPDNSTIWLLADNLAAERVARDPFTSIEDGAWRRA